MDSTSRRRQFHSCDRCRRSKRRCVLLADETERCRNCAKLSYTCTFNFASSHEVRKQRVQQQSQHPAIDGGHESYLASSETDSFLSTFDSAREFPGVLVPEGSDTDLTPLPFPSSTFAPNPEQGNDHIALSGGGFGANCVPPDVTSQIWPATSSNRSTVVQHLSPPSQKSLDASTFLARNTPIVCSSRSPTALLNSTLTLDLANKYLSSIFDSMTAALAFRYLSQRTNLFAGTYSYEITSDKQMDDLVRNGRLIELKPMQTSSQAENHSAGGNSATNTGVSRSPEDPCMTLDYSLGSASAESDGINVTLVGIARFLDNFGAFYGNARSRTARAQDEAVLRTVVQAFALQHAPLTSSNSGPINTANPDRDHLAANEATHLHRQAWVKACHELVVAKTSRSFLRLYTVFIFHLLVPPEDVGTILESDSSPDGLLDVALYQMNDLFVQVEAYCVHLSVRSMYRGLLESCIRIVKWHGFVRDTIASLRSDRLCVLADGAWELPILPQSSTTPDIKSFDNNVPTLCQDACSHVFALYRKIINLRVVLNDQMLSCGTGTIAHEVQSITTLLDSYDSTVGLWLQRCFDDFLQLSVGSQLSAGFLVMFWNLGVLCFIEAIQSTCGDSANLCPDVFATLRYYRQQATSSFGTISRLIMDSSADSEVLIFDDNDLRKPFMAQHANTQLVVMALQKAIEHTIDLHYNSRDTANDNSDWIQRLKPVVWCLWTLERTNAGRYTARLAMVALVERYGDLLMECWTPDDL